MITSPNIIYHAFCIPPKPKQKCPCLSTPSRARRFGLSHNILLRKFDPALAQCLKTLILGNAVRVLRFQQVLRDVRLQEPTLITTSRATMNHPRHENMHKFETGAACINSQPKNYVIARTKGGFCDDRNRREWLAITETSPSSVGTKKFLRSSEAGFIPKNTLGWEAWRPS